MENNWKIVFLVAIFVGGILSLFASSSPDGLERVAEREGFLERGVSLFVSPLEDSVVLGIGNETLAMSFAGIFGTMLLFVLLFFLGRKLFSFD